jgi:cytochrome b involved in lipid metabolism
MIDSNYFVNKNLNLPDSLTEESFQNESLFLNTPGSEEQFSLINNEFSEKTENLFSEVITENLQRENAFKLNRDFFFHPLAETHSTKSKLASVVTLIALSILTCGIYLAIFAAVNLYDRFQANKKITVSEQPKNNINSINNQFDQNSDEDIYIHNESPMQFSNLSQFPELTNGDGDLQENIKKLSKKIRDEVAKHNTVDDLWVIYEGNVYDITGFEVDHPGGDEVLTDAAGTDVTDLFKDFGHSVEALEQMQYYILPLEEVVKDLD